MHPILFEIGSFTIYSYGFCILLGVLFAYAFVSKKSKILGGTTDKISEIILYTILASVIGGKVFLYLADIPRYLANPSEMFKDFGSGFVFYGSFLFALPTLLWCFKKNNLPTMKMFDIVAIGGTMVHGMGKIGCFLAGCCHGKVCNESLGVVYSNLNSSALPLNTPLYPTQLYDAAIIFSIMIILILLLPKKKFDGQLILIYVILYAIGRFCTEFLRGDTDRGTVLNGILSQSQFVAICLFILGIGFYIFLKNKKKI